MQGFFMPDNLKVSNLLMNGNFLTSTNIN